MPDHSVDFVASSPHYLEHLAPVWRALPEDRRGGFFVPATPTPVATVRLAAKLGVPATVALIRPPEQLPSDFTGPIVAASHIDVEWVSDLTHRPLVLAEHGAGQTYEDAIHYGSVPGRGVDYLLSLQLLPGEAAKGGECEQAVVGSPRVEQLLEDYMPPQNDRPVVAVSFHWECGAVPEAYGAWMYYASAVSSLTDHYRVLGHAHPRVFPKVEPVYEAFGIEPVEDFEEVFKQADVYACDNSSTIYEFAASDRPVVLLDAPWFRRDVEHGMRFWEHASVGVQCREPRDLPSSVRTALEDHSWSRAARRKAVSAVYAHPHGGAAHAAAQAVAGIRS